MDSFAVLSELLKILLKFYLVNMPFCNEKLILLLNPFYNPKKLHEASKIKTELRHSRNSKFVTCVNDVSVAYLRGPSLALILSFISFCSVYWYPLYSDQP